MDISMELKEYYLYKITNILNNKVYIGQTVRPKERWSQHKTYAKLEKPIQYIHYAIVKYGIKNFIFEVIATCRSQEDANEVENILIQQYNSRDKEYGYNIAPGGDISWNRGLPKEQQPMYGKKQSEFFKQRMSEIHKGKLAPHSSECKIKISKSLLGHAVSKETKEKISKSLLGIIRSFETKSKMSKAASQRIFSEKTKIKMSNSQKLVLQNKTGVILNYEIAEQIRLKYVSKKYSMSELANMYCVHKATISKIINNKIWVI